MIIKANFPVGRLTPGTLTATPQGGEGFFGSFKGTFGPVPAFGKSDNLAAINHGNPTRDPIYMFGDTPTGTYNCHFGTVPVMTDEIKAGYGPFGWISLDPTAGQALQAKANGRHGILIHAGDPNALGHLRPTYGCIRLADSDLGKLLDLLKPFWGQEAVTCEVTEG